MQVWDVLHAARWKCRTQKIAKIGHLRIITQLYLGISSQLTFLHFFKSRPNECIVQRKYWTARTDTGEWEYIPHQSPLCGDVNITSVFLFLVPFQTRPKFSNVSWKACPRTSVTSLWQPQFRWSHVCNCDPSASPESSVLKWISSRIQLCTLIQNFAVDSISNWVSLLVGHQHVLHTLKCK